MTLNILNSKSVSPAEEEAIELILEGITKGADVADQRSVPQPFKLKYCCPVV